MIDQLETSPGRSSRPGDVVLHGVLRVWSRVVRAWGVLSVRTGLTAAVVRRWTSRVLIATFVAAIALSYGVPLWYHLKGEQLLVVTSGSMRPTVREGDAVVVHPISPTELRRNMVITFWTASGRPRMLETHRIVDLKTLPVTDNGGHPVLDSAGNVLERQVIQTKGDGNQYPDPNMTPVTNVRGVVVDVKQGWGRQLLWAHSPIGRLFLFGPPLLLLLGAEVLSWRRRPPARPHSSGNGARDAAALTV